jgi:nucleoside-diphosphate-sugar epimerase
MSPKLLITGGTGFVGQNVVRFLADKKINVDIYNLSRTPLELDGVKNIECDASNFNFSDLGNIEFDYIINLLALSHDKDCQDFTLAQEININFTRKLLEYSLTQKRLKKIIHLSSAIIYDNTNRSPVSEDSKLHLNYSTYSFTKGISEYYVNFYREKFKLPIIIFRLSNIYGPYQKIKNSSFLIPSKISQALDSGKIEVFDLTPRRDWIYSVDAAAAIVLALDADYSGILNLASGIGVSVEEIISEIAAQLSVKYFSLNKNTSGPLNFYCDIEKTKKVLSWQPTTNLKEGIYKTVEYFKKIKNN